MPTKKKVSATTDDLLYLLQKLYDRFGGLETRFDRFEKHNHEEHELFKQNDEKLLEMVSNLVISVGKVEEELIFLNHHNSEHFDKDEEQDKRLTRVESHLQLPKLAF